MPPPRKRLRKVAVHVSSSPRRQQRFPSRRSTTRRPISKLPGKTESQNTLTQLDFCKLFARQPIVLDSEDEENLLSARQDSGSDDDGALDRGKRERRRVTAAERRQQTLTQIDFLREIPDSDGDEEEEVLLDDTGRSTQPGHNIEKECRTSQGEDALSTIPREQYDTPARETSRGHSYDQFVDVHDFGAAEDPVSSEERGTCRNTEAQEIRNAQDTAHANDRRRQVKWAQNGGNNFPCSASGMTDETNHDAHQSSEQCRGTSQPTAMLKEELPPSQNVGSTRRSKRRLEVPSSQSPVTTPPATKSAKQESPSRRSPLRERDANMLEVPETPKKRIASDKQTASLLRSLPRTATKPENSCSLAKLARKYAGCATIPDSEDDTDHEELDLEVAANDDTPESKSNSANYHHNIHGSTVARSPKVDESVGIVARGEEQDYQILPQHPTPSDIGSPIMYPSSPSADDVIEAVEVVESDSLPNLGSPAEREEIPFSQMSTVDPSEHSPRTQRQLPSSPGFTTPPRFPLLFSSSPAYDRRVTLSQLLPESLIGDSIPPPPGWPPRQ